MHSDLSDTLRRHLASLWGALKDLRHRHDFLILAALAVLATGAFGFAQIAELASEGEARAAEERVLLAFREAGDPSDPIGGVAVEEAVRDLTALGGVLLTTLVTLLAASFFLLDHRPRAAGFFVAAIVGGVAVTFALKAGFDRPRPDLVARQMEALSASFPSGHSATAAVVYLTLGAFVARALPKLRLRVLVMAAAIVITLAIGVSRVYLGVHWPTDVLAGWTVGAVWALSCWLLERDFRRRGWIEPSSTLQTPSSQPTPRH
jgi:undecaprenyl-diphosphatase